MYTRLRRLAHTTARALAALAGLLIAVLMFLTVFNVLGRQLEWSAVGGGIELTEVALVVVVYLGMAQAQIRGAHVSTTVLTSRLPVRAASWIRIGGLTAAVLVVLLLTWFGIERALIAVRESQVRFGGAGIPLWPAYVSIVVGFFSLFIVYLFSLLDAIRAMRSQPGVHPADERPAPKGRT